MLKHRNDDVRGLDCSGAEPLVESYLDGELSGARLVAFEAHLERCEACAGELDLARRIQGELHELPLLSCPPEVSRAVFGYAEAHPSLFERLRRLWGPRRVWQPVLATLLAVALGVGYWRLAGPQPPISSPPPEPAYTAEEIAQAEAELKLALAYLGDIGQKAQQRFSTEVSEHMVTPFTRSLAGALFLQPQSDKDDPSADKVNGG